MSNPSKSSSATGREIIAEILRNMQEGLEPMHFSTLVPAVYTVYLHTDDLERLRPVRQRLVDEAKRALDAELANLNRAPLSARLGLGGKNSTTYERPIHGWHIELLENGDEEAQPGDIVIHSELALPERADLATGSMTKRIATSRIAGEQTARMSYGEAHAPTPVSSAGDGVFATIDYEDNSGRHSYSMTADQIVIGRGGREYWTDLKLNTIPDVSREHLRLRRDPASGEFFVKDLSRLGTTIDGKQVASSIEVVNGEKRDKNVEVKLPDKARIGLAGVVFLEFEAVERQ